jgi:hypothetical protein
MIPFPEKVSLDDLRGQPHLRGQLTLDRNTGEVIRWEPSSNNALGRRLRSWLRFARTVET